MIDIATIEADLLANSYDHGLIICQFPTGNNVSIEHAPCSGWTPELLQDAVDALYKNETLKNNENYEAYLGCTLIGTTKTC